MRSKYLFHLAILLALLAGAFPAKVQALVIPPADMFQLPWERGLSWIAMDGIDNGYKRPSSSPHNYKKGGAVDFAPHVGMRIGEDTSKAWVTAAAGGTVFEISNCHIKIDHGNGWTTEYYHLGNIQVKLGDTVTQNQKLAIVDNNAKGRVCVGNTWPGPHLHFVIRPNMVDATLAGWNIKYDVKTNKTTFNKNGQSLGSFQPILNTFDAIVAQRELLAWDTTYTGNVDAYRYERWGLQLSGSQTFTITTTPTSSGLTPLLILMDANGNEIARATGTLTSTQPVGNYFVQVQPQAGSGSYTIIATKQAGSTDPGGEVDVEDPNINVGDLTLVNIRLVNVPSTGYTSAEFTCTYDPTLVEASNISIAGLFGNDPASAINGPQNGKFIVAIAGSNGSRATTDGIVFSFYLKGLQAGQASVDCKPRVSKGDNQLIDLPSTPVIIVIGGTAPPTPTNVPTETAPPPTPIDATPTSVPSTPTDATPTSIPPTATAVPPTPTLPVVSGRVIASKPVTISIYSADSMLVNTITTNLDGTFNFNVSFPGNYTIIASATGYLNAQGSVTLAYNAVTTLPTISLPAGDIDANSVIDQYDVLTIGMNYNSSSPAAADLNNDSTINVLDLELLAANYRKSGSLMWQ
jgi:murein DD-endopeptidase MepM/ murein hydrolase activator NlpD